MAKKRGIEHRSGNVVYLNRPPKRERLVKGSRAAMVAALLAFAGGVWAVRECGSEPPRESKDAGMSPEQRRMMESQWMYRVQLPEIGKFEPREWKSDGGSIQEGSSAVLEGFSLRFGELGRDAERRLAPLRDEKAREQVISDYLIQVLQAYKMAVGDRTPETLKVGSEEFDRLMLKLNDALVPNGAYLHVKFDQEFKTRITQYRVGQTGEARVGERSVRVSQLQPVRSLNLRPGDPTVRVNGVYQAKVDTAVLDGEGADLQLGPMVEAYRIRCQRAGGTPRDLAGKEVRDDHRALALSHEMAHAYLSSVDYDARRSDALVRRGGIPMGTYDFPLGILAKVNNAQLHELFANGIGLMKSGEAAPVVAHSLVVGDQTNYMLARDLIWREIVFSPDLDPQFSRDLLRDINATQSIPLDRMVEAINRLSPEALHRIGERMAKAALYLMGK